MTYRISVFFVCVVGYFCPVREHKYNDKTMKAFKEIYERAREVLRDLEGLETSTGTELKEELRAIKDLSIQRGNEEFMLFTGKEAKWWNLANEIGNSKLFAVWK